MGLSTKVYTVNNMVGRNAYILMSFVSCVDILMTEIDPEGIHKYSLESLILYIRNASTKLQCSQVCRRCITQRTRRTDCYVNLTLPTPGYCGEKWQSIPLTIFSSQIYLSLNLKDRFLPQIYSGVSCKGLMKALPIENNSVVIGLSHEPSIHLDIVCESTAWRKLTFVC